MSTRPKSVTFLSWFFIAAAALGGIAFIFTINNPTTKDIMSRSPIPISIQYLMTCVGTVVNILCGIMMLQGKNWARLLFVVWTTIVVLISFVTAPLNAKLMILPSALVSGVFFFFLFRPKANEYFK